MDSTRQTKAMLRVLGGEALSPPPIWLMRQAGRYLPEYRAVRAQAPDFMAFCADAEKSAEVTFQPIRRFAFDASIVFSDIMVVPHAMGQKVWFETGEGPRLEPVANRQALEGLHAFDPAKVSGTLEALVTLRAGLPQEVALIGFCGAPWTIATYMVAGRGSPDKAAAKDLAAADPALFSALIDRVVESSITYLVAQVDSGAEILQIFDSWAGALDAKGFELWSIEPIARILAGVRAVRPGVPIIVFAREAPIPALREGQAAWRAEGLSLGQGTSISEARHALGEDVALQGNLDPEILVRGGADLKHAVAHILEVSRGTPHIFNLGHGIVPQTPISHVEDMLAQVRGA